jgi:hypothetical protein
MLLGQISRARLMLSAPLLADFAHVRISPPSGAGGEDEHQDAHKGDADGEGPRHRPIMTDSATRGNGQIRLHPPSHAAQAAAIRELLREEIARPVIPAAVRTAQR